MVCGGPSSAHSISHVVLSRTPKHCSNVNADGCAAPKSYAAIGPANVIIPLRASAASWNAVKSEWPSQRVGLRAIDA